MKKKVSITIDADLLSQVEEIAKKQGSNRSKYIEKVLLSQTRQIPLLILAAHAQINKKDKALTEYKSKNLIEHQISYAKNQGFLELYISTDSKKLKSYIEQNHPDVTVITESSKLGSAGTLKRVKEVLGRRFIFMYCDILVELNLNELVKFHLRNKSSTTLVLKSQRNVSKYGVAVLEGSRITQFEEKPEKSDSHLISIGLGIIETHAAEALKTGKFEFQLNELENKHGYIYEGFWKNFEEEKDF